jgi:DNA-binding response OmpR family regulator
MGHTVLVVDDHAPTVDVIRDALAPQGFEVISAVNGAECLAAVAQEEPDLVILDIHMPVLNGLDTLRLLRQGVGEDNLPVIMLSGRGHFADVRKAWKRGADIYLTKPIRVGAVVAAVKWLLQSDDATGPSQKDEVASGPALSAVVGSDLLP